MRLISVAVYSLLAAYTRATPILTSPVDVHAAPDVLDVRDLIARDEVFPRQNATVDVNANEFIDAGCKDVVLVYARGSTQDGNVGDQPGPQLITALQASLGADRVAAQGVDYEAGLAQNLIPGGADPDETADMAALITNVSSTCPTSKIAVSGYSQGAALLHGAMKQISDQTVKDQIAAAVTFGDTQKEQDNNQIPGVDPARTLILCNDGDLVCEGTLLITEAHLDYTGKVQQASDFITGLVK